MSVYGGMNPCHIATVSLECYYCSGGRAFVNVHYAIIACNIHKLREHRIIETVFGWFIFLIRVTRNDETFLYIIRLFNEYGVLRNSSENTCRPIVVAFSHYIVLYTETRTLRYTLLGFS